ncbi:hypothetical protein [Alkaliphilus transvaalensis]|uniref:hypothetical protein n=1 Tax=Alkaliphilus transvaalensis TaxID=114628 RepID=UPI00047A1A4C|nr:hypothetical protein [Alkaliphilus transvaalensis]
MSEVATNNNNNDFLSSLFGGIGRGKGGINPIVLCLILFLCLSGGGKGGCGGKGGFGSFFGLLDENLILVFVILLILFGGTGSFKF